MEEQLARITVGDALRAKRQQTNLSARAASLAAGLSESYLGKIEKGEVDDISLRCFAHLAKALSMTDIEVAYVIRWEASR